MARKIGLDDDGSNDEDSSEEEDNAGNGISESTAITSPKRKKRTHRGSFESKDEPNGLFTHYRELIEKAFPERIFSEYGFIRYVNFMTSNHPLLQMFGQKTESVSATAIGMDPYLRSNGPADRFKSTSLLLYNIMDVLVFAAFAAIITRYNCANDGTCELIGKEAECNAGSTLLSNTNYCSWNFEDRYCYFDQHLIKQEDLIFYASVIVMLSIPISHFMSFICHKTCSRFLFAAKMKQKSLLGGKVAAIENDESSSYDVENTPQRENEKIQ